MIRSAALALTVLLASLPLVASAQLAPGTTLTGSIDQSLDSRSAQVNQTFTISNAHSPNHDINGAVIYGHVDSVQRAGQGTAGKVHLAFDKVNTRSGNIYQIDGYATNVNVQTKSNSSKEILSTAGGALVGGLLGHGIGAVIGGGAGYAISHNNKQNVTIPQGSLVTVQITQSRRQGY